MKPLIIYFNSGKAQQHMHRIAHRVFPVQVGKIHFSFEQAIEEVHGKYLQGPEME